MKKLFISMILCSISCAAQISLKVTSPTSGATVTPQVTVTAAASSSRPITGWHIYADSKDVYAGPASSTVKGTFTLTTGAHALAVRAWDSSGAYSTQYLNITVATPPPTTPLSVSVAAPVSGATVTSPFTLTAAASGSNSIAGWHVYVDNIDTYTGPPTSSINPSLSLATGSHTIIVRAWDSTGAYSSYNLNVNVAQPASALPTPPANAVVFNNIDQATKWDSCGSAACAGGSGKSNYWQALNQSNPSLDGNSMHLYNSGVWANALWWTKFGAQNWATNMLWDFWIYVDGTAAPYAQTFEFDSFQFVDGWNYMVGTQCNYAYGVWDTWDEYAQKWIHNNNLPCPKFSPNTWHHVQQYVTLNHTNHTYTYKTFVVDGNAITVNQTQPAKYLGWNNNIGVQWQIDVNASGAGVHEWVDKAKLTIW